MKRGLFACTLIGILALAGTAAAQDPPETPPLSTFSIALSVSPSNEPITPVNDTRTTTIAVTITCEQGSVYGGTTPAGTPDQAQYTVNTTHPQATVTASPAATSLEFAPEDCLQGADIMDNVTVTVQLSAEALAEETVPIELTATLTDGTTETVGWDHTVGHYFRTQVRLDEAMHTAEPGTTIEAPGTVENLGNAAVRFVFSELPDDERRIRSTLPDPLVVEPFSDSTFTITLDVPSSSSVVDRRDEIIIRTQVLLDADPNIEGAPHDLSLVVQTQGGSGESPGPALPFLVVFATALWAGRRRTVSTV